MRPVGHKTFHCADGAETRLQLPESAVEWGRGWGASWAQPKAPDSRSGIKDAPLITSAQVTMPAHMVSHDKSRESQHPSACSLHLPASVLESGRGLGASWAQSKGPDSNSGKTEQTGVSQAQGGGALVIIHWCHITCVGGCVGDRVGRAVGTTVGSWEGDGCRSAAGWLGQAPCPTRTT